VVAGLPVTALLGTLIIPRFGWRIMFVLGGLGALVVWHLRKALPESPRWLESIGRTAEADRLLQAIEQEVSLHHGPLKQPISSPPSTQSRDLSALLTPVLLPRMIVGATTLIAINTLIFGFITWLPTFFVQA
jgi:putative MFS transporter